MTTTSPRVSFGFYAMVVKRDSEPVCVDLQSFCKLDDLVTDNVAPRPYITFEPDFWLLSGEFRFIPNIDDAIHVGLMSESMSDESGNFEAPPILTVEFSEVHTIDSLTLLFARYSNDYATDITVEYYNAIGVLISSTVYHPTNWEFVTGDEAENFKQIKIIFHSTNKPYRYLRLTGIDYGTLVTFEGTDIKSATLIEQVDPISVTLPSNALELSIYSSDARFSILNPQGDYAALQKRQELAVIENVGDDQLFIGNFYLDDWENPTVNSIEFKCIDLIGVLDGVPYNGGLWKAGEITLSELLKDMFGSISTPYDLDTVLYDVPVIGWIPICSYREALQQLAFMAGAYVSCSRSGVIQIYQSTLASKVWTAEYQITKAMKGIDSPISQKTLITGVEVTSHDFVENTVSNELYNGHLVAGTHTITFTVPMHDLTVSGGTIIDSGANYANVKVVASGTVVLSGQGYTDTSKVHGIYTTGLDESVKSNIVSIVDATLIHSVNAAVITQRIYDYYQQRYLQKTKLFAPPVEVGKSAIVDTLYGQQIQGVIEKMSIDLAMGFVANTEIVGVVNG